MNDVRRKVWPKLQDLNRERNWKEDKEEINK